jgi:hypothetical protein
MKIVCIDKKDYPVFCAAKDFFANYRTIKNKKLVSHFALSVSNKINTTHVSYDTMDTQKKFLGSES